MLLRPSMHLGTSWQPSILSRFQNQLSRAKIGFKLIYFDRIMHVKGVTLVGPLPSALQLNNVYGAAAMGGNSAPEPALEFLADPANRKIWKEAGFDSPESKPM
jgi:hypothetical protein